MPTSPYVKFNFENNNVQTSFPTLGVTAVVARTTKGPFNQPDEVLRNITQFSEIYGKELVPDGTTSNIERAFATGSMLRVSRVAGADELAKGVAKSYDPATSKPSEVNATLVLSTVNPLDATQKASFSFNIFTKEFGSSIVEPTSESTNSNFFIQVVSKVSGTGLKYHLTQFKSYDKGAVNAAGVLDSRLLLSTTLEGAAKPFTDGSSFESFIRMVPNLEFVLASSTITSIKTVEDVVAYLRLNTTHRAYIQNGEVPMVADNAAIDFIINEGQNGGESDKTTWLAAYEELRNHVDQYQVILSHIHQHIPSTWEAAANSIALLVSKDFESMLYVEIPKVDANDVITTPKEIAELANAMMSSVGSHKAIAYFAGGLKFYGSNGALQKNDVLGTVIGLGDSSAANYGPWMSFSGMNRGLVPTALGPVMKNLGSPALYDELNKLAEAKVNLFVIKDTPTAGRQTMLWHGFTSEVLNNSNKFIASVRLQLFLKKNIRPIMERYLEEPNYIHTWLNIYYEVKDVIDELVPNAISEYTWYGDQFATGYGDMQVNKEADVRLGKYKARMVYKDVVSMQEVELTFSVDSVTRDISVE